MLPSIPGMLSLFSVQITFGPQAHLENFGLQQPIWPKNGPFALFFLLFHHNGPAH